MSIDELTPAQIVFLSHMVGENNELAYIHTLLNGDPANISLLSTSQKAVLQTQLNLALANRPDFPKSVVVQPVSMSKKAAVNPLVWIGAAAAIYWFFFRKKSSEGGA